MTQSHIYAIFGKKSRLGEAVPQSLLDIASDRRERGNLLICNALRDCFGRLTPSQSQYNTASEDPALMFSLKWIFNGFPGFGKLLGVVE